MGTNVPTTKEIIREIVNITRPDDAASTQVHLTHTALRNQLAIVRLTDPSVADEPLTPETLKILQLTVARFRNSDALEYLNALEIPQTPSNPVQRLYQSVRTLCNKVLLRSKPQEDPVGEPSYVPSTLD